MGIMLNNAGRVRYAQTALPVPTGYSFTCFRLKVFQNPEKFFFLREEEGVEVLHVSEGIPVVPGDTGPAINVQAGRRFVRREQVLMFPARTQAKPVKNKLP